MNEAGKPQLQIPSKSDDPQVEVRLSVNGHDVSRTVSSRMLFSDFLRHELGLTGTHVGCEHGVCGACTILVNGKSARSCLAFAIQMNGAEVETVESEANKDGTLSVLQNAFRDCHGLQCGYCTPGLLMSIKSYFQSGEKLDLSDEGIREVISGNICRCTGYANIISAVRQAAQELGLG